VLTHRYRLTETGGALQRTGWVVFVLLLIYSAWVLVIGVTFLFYADRGEPFLPGRCSSIGIGIDIRRIPPCPSRVGAALESGASRSVTSLTAREAEPILATDRNGPK
jgi:hypothetical protein